MSANNDAPFVVWVILAVVLILLGVVVMWAMEQRPEDGE